MKEVYFTVPCNAVYRGSLMVPDNIKGDGLVDFINKHLDLVPVSELDWIGDSPVEESDIRNWKDFTEADPITHSTRMFPSEEAYLETL